MNTEPKAVNMKRKYVSQTGNFPSGNPRLYYRPPGRKIIPLPDEPMDSPEMDEAYKALREKFKPVKNVQAQNDVVRALKTCLRKAKVRAKGKEVDADVTIEDLAYLLQKQGSRCALTGLKFDLKRSNHGRRRPFAPSIDRIDTKVGYTFGNIRLVCTIANLARSDFGDKAFMSMCRGAVSHGKAKNIQLKKPSPNF